MQIKASLHKKGRFFYSILPSFEACSFKRGGFAGQYARTKPSAIFARRQRHTKSLSCIKPPGKAGRFDETTRRLAGGFCFMPRGARFVVPGWCAGGQNKTPPSGRRAGKLHIIRPASRSTSRACRMRRTAGSSAWRQSRQASCRTRRRCRATGSRRTGRRRR